MAPTSLGPSYVDGRVVSESDSELPILLCSASTEDVFVGLLTSGGRPRMPPHLILAVPRVGHRSAAIVNSLFKMISAVASRWRGR